MNQMDRLSQYPLTEKQRAFEWDFRKGTDRYEVWDEIQVGRSEMAQNTFVVEEEDILSFNLSTLDGDRRMTDAQFAAEHGGLVQHPLFVVQVVFYCIGTGIGSWIRSPGARNPGQVIEFFEDFVVGEEITATITHRDKWIRRGNHYMEDQVDLHNDHGTLKARWFARLLLPENRTALERFATA
jgi:hypothetical protein